MSGRHAWIMVVLGLAVGPAQAAEDLFPFVVAYDAPANATNVSDWLPKPAGAQGFLRVEKGRLVNDAGPVRVWGTNLCFEACFPSREQAERVARRLARLGINCVRMHHMDSRSIWGDSPNKLIIDPKKLERLDYLIYQLKQNGIYTNLNLHVSRWFDEAEGFPHRQSRPNYDKGLDNFEPRMIELQKKYARDLLTHVSPYTRTPYTQEPAIAFVEISNEDALFAVWGWGQLDDLPDPYAATFRKQWNAWLRQKYGSTEKLRQAWNVGAAPLGEELLRNGDFSSPLGREWSVERDAQTVCHVSIETAPPGEPDALPAKAPGTKGTKGKVASPCAGPPGSAAAPRRFLRIVVQRQGQVAWRPQLVQAGFALKKDSPYTLTFQLRADQARRAAVNCMMAHEPWERLGLSADVKLTSQWRPFRFTFVAERDDPNARISFTSLSPGTYELASVSLRPGGIAGLEPGQALEDDSVPVLRRSQMHLTRQARDDFIDFLWDSERDYWHGMYRFLKEELGVKALVAGTQLSYSPAHIQAGLDYIDAHSYWHHPAFPGRPWDPQNWYVHNAALVNSLGGTLSRLAATRVAGMAYTVSEYNHPAPIQYAAEGFPMIAAFGAFQNWDGIYSFAYNHNTNFEPRRIEGFFDIKADPAKLVHMPACAAMFLRGDVLPARQLVRAAISRDAERAKLHETTSAWNIQAGQFGVDPLVALLHGLAIDLKPDASAKPPHIEKTGAVFLSDTGQIRWDVSQPGRGYFTVNTPRTKLFTGFVRGRTFPLGEVMLQIGKTRLDWATVSLVALDGKGFDAPGRVLVAATGWVQNAGAELESLGGDRVTLRNRWGYEPVLCEGVPARITLPVPPARVRFYPLDESGNRRPAAPVEAAGDRAVLELGPQFKTLWYEAEILR